MNNEIVEIKSFAAGHTALTTVLGGVDSGTGAIAETAVTAGTAVSAFFAGVRFAWRERTGKAIVAEPISTATPMADRNAKAAADRAHAAAKLEEARKLFERAYGVQS